MSSQARDKSARMETGTRELRRGRKRKRLARADPQSSDLEATLDPPGTHLLQSWETVALGEARINRLEDYSVDRG